MRAGQCWASGHSFNWYSVPSFTCSSLFEQLGCLEILRYKTFQDMMNDRHPEQTEMQIGSNVATLCEDNPTQQPYHRRKLRFDFLMLFESLSK